MDRPRVLVIDDDDLVRRTIARALRMRCNMEDVASAEEALERIRAGTRYEMIILDLSLPSGMSARSFCAEIEARDAVQAARIVIYTGSAKTADDQHFLASRMPRVIMKPASTSTILEMLDVFREMYGVAA